MQIPLCELYFIPWNAFYQTRVLVWPSWLWFFSRWPSCPLFWRTIHRVNRISSDYSDFFFFFSCPRCLTVCKSFGYLESPAPGLIIEQDTSWTIIPQRVCLPVCLQCQHITMSTRVTSSIQHGRTGGRAARRFAAARGTDSLFAPAINVYAGKTIFFPRPILTYHLHDNISSAPPVFSVLCRKLGKIMCAHARTETRSCSIDENLPKKKKHFVSKFSSKLCRAFRRAAELLWVSEDGERAETQSACNHPSQADKPLLLYKTDSSK